jgi:hypothetical protein
MEADANIENMFPTNFDLAYFEGLNQPREKIG